MRSRESALTLIGLIVTIVFAAAICGLVIYCCIRCAKRVRALGKRYEHRLTNELAQSALFLPWTVVDGEFTFEIPDEEVEPMLDRLTEVTVQSSDDFATWQDRVTVRTDPLCWQWLAEEIMRADQQTTTNQMRVYRARW